jgi:hypothetical protein
VIEASVDIVALTSFIGLCVVAGIASVLQRSYAKRQARLGLLICRYNDYSVAHRVLRREVWLDQTEAQLLHSRGEPARKNRMLATPEREEWIYSPRGIRRHRQQVTLQNGLVTGWGSATIRPVGARYPTAAEGRNESELTAQTERNGDPVSI